MIIQFKDGFERIMSKDIVPAIANTAVVSGATTGFWAFVSENASVISVTAAVLSMIIALVFNIINTRIRKEAAELDNEKKRLEIDQMKQQIELRKLESIDDK